MKLIRTFQTAAVLGALALFSGTVQAQAATSNVTCDAINRDIVAGLLKPDSAFISRPDCAPSNNTVVGTQTVQSTSINQALTISNQITVALSTLFGTGPARISAGQLGTGLAASAASNASNTWVNYSYNKVDFTREHFNYDSKLNNLIVGYDRRLSQNLVAGVSGAYDDGKVDVKFADGAIDSSGITIAPYVGYQINQTFSADASAGLGKGKFDNRTGTQTGSNKSDRQFFAANLNYVRWTRDIQWLGKASFLDASEKKDSYTLSGNGVSTLIPGATNSLSQFRLGAQVGYWNNGMMPYASLTYSTDLRRSNNVNSGTTQLDKDAWVVGLGVNLFTKGSIWGGLSYTSELGRSDMRNNVFLANLNIRY